MNTTSFDSLDLKKNNSDNNQQLVKRNMSTEGKTMPHRSDHSYEERDDLFFISDDERDSADLAENSDEGKELSFFFANSCCLYHV